METFLLVFSTLSTCLAVGFLIRWLTRLEQIIRLLAEKHNGLVQACSDNALELEKMLRSVATDIRILQQTYRPSKPQTPGPLS